MSYAAIARKYDKQINRKQAWREVSKHAHMGHVGKYPERMQPPNPGTFTDIVEKRHKKTVEERIDQLYDMAMLGAKLALYEDKADPVTKKPKMRSERDIRGLAACLAQGIAAAKLQHESDGMAKLQEEIDALRETMAKND